MQQQPWLGGIGQHLRTQAVTHLQTFQTRLGVGLGSFHYQYCIIPFQYCTKHLHVWLSSAHRVMQRRLPALWRPTVLCNHVTRPMNTQVVMRQHYSITNSSSLHIITAHQVVMRNHTCATPKNQEPNIAAQSQFARSCHVCITLLLCTDC